MRTKILIVDDSPSIIKLVSGILTEYHLIFALDGLEALRILREENNISLILLDIEMPNIDGYKVIEEIKENSDLARIPVIFLTVRDDFAAEAYGLGLGAVDYIRKPINAAILKQRIRTHINLYLSNIKKEKQNESLESKVEERTYEVVQTRGILIQIMMSMLEIRDIESGQHIKRTKLYMEVICNYLLNNGPYIKVLDKKIIEDICWVAPLHDIGKVGIPDSILLKKGKLSEDEFEMMKLHTVYAVEAFTNVGKTISENNIYKVAKEIAGYHHEKWDGTGYPYGLKGEEIPLCARMMALADVYDALVNKRIYKEAFSHERAKSIIINDSGAHFDPIIVEAFLECEEDFVEIYKKHRG